MKYLLFVAGVALNVPAQSPYFLDEWAIPDRIYECIEKAGQSAREPLVTFGALNPYYLRGDFDGDGVPDLALAVVGDREPRAHSRTEAFELLSTRNNGGILICSASKPPALLGAISKDARPDALSPLFTPGWRVETRAQMVEILVKLKRMSRPDAASLLGNGRGEVIWLVGEDSSSLIYFRAGRYRVYDLY